MEKLNAIVIEDKVYELSRNSDPDVCERCALANSNTCNAPHWLNCNCIILEYSQSLTDKLNSNGIQQEDTSASI